MKMKLCSIMLIGLVLVLATSLLSCGYDHVDKAEDSLKKALRATTDLRRQFEWGVQPQNIDSELQYIEMLIEDALQELHDMRPEY